MFIGYAQKKKTIKQVVLLILNTSVLIIYLTNLVNIYFEQHEFSLSDYAYKNDSLHPKIML